jgi:hypothetical protein
MSDKSKPTDKKSKGGDKPADATKTGKVAAGGEQKGGKDAPKGGKDKQKK